MTIKKLNTFSILVSISLAIIAFAGIHISSVFAQTPTIVLTINGSPSATIIDGETVSIEWYLDGQLSNCTLRRNGSVIRTIDTSATPVNGSLSEVPPTGSETSYGLNCDGISDSVTAAVSPVVTLSLPQGDNRIADSVTGSLGGVNVRWESEYATECSNVWMVQSGPTNTYYANSAGDYGGDKNKRNGTVWFDGSPHPSINRTTTFYITCTNTINGSSETDSVTLTVVDPPPPEPPVVNLWTNTPLVSQDPLYGYARADVRFNSTGVSRCYYKAYYEDGTEYTDLPRGFGAWVGRTSNNFTNIRIIETTDFEVECTRNAFTRNGVSYPATSSKSVVRVDVVGSGTVQDRSTLPPVTAYATVTPNPAVKNAITGEALISIETDVENADYCYQKAYRFDSSTGDYDDQYDLDGWTLAYSWNRRGNGERNYTAFISESTRLEMSCRREYDYYNNPGADYENGVEVTSVVVIAEEPSAAAGAPKTYVYGNAYYMDADAIIDTATANIGFTKEGDIPRVPRDASGNSITLPFVHPFGGSGQYNIHIQYYDENDGESNFRVYGPDNTLLDSWTSNDPLSDSAVPIRSTKRMRTVAVGLTLNDGDEIRIDCDAVDGEFCRFNEVYFGSGDGSSVNVPANDTTGFTSVPIMWVSKNTTRCHSAEASVSGAGSYQWYFGNSTAGIRNIDVSTTTEFSITCERETDSQFDESSVEVRLPQSVALGAEILVASGECVDPNTLQTVTAPDGFIADTNPDSSTYRQCIPAVDLAAVSPSFSQGAENNVDGTYDTVDALMVIRNLGPGDLPAGEGIAYMGRMTFQPVYALPTLDTAVGSFSGSITAAEIESPTLTRTFTDVPFGTHTVCSRVNLDNSPDNYPEASTNFANNQNCTTITLPVPRPPMTLTASRDVIRSGQTVDIDWGVNVTYELQCTVQGAGGLSESFNTLLTGSGHSDSFTTNPLTSTSEFIFQCTEPITGTTFTENTTVEVVPDFEEI